LEKAEKALDGAISLNPKSAPAFAHRGSLRQQQKNYPGAILDYESALQLGSTHWENRAQVERALNSLKKKIQADEDDYY
jgi:tetratricopeptide (TPR) repeat protein